MRWYKDLISIRIKRDKRWSRNQIQLLICRNSYSRLKVKKKYFRRHWLKRWQVNCKVWRMRCSSISKSLKCRDKVYWCRLSRDIPITHSWKKRCSEWIRSFRIRNGNELVICSKNAYKLLNLKISLLHFSSLPVSKSMNYKQSCKREESSQKTK